MRALALVLILLVLSGCTTATKDTRPRQCGGTPVELKEMEAFGFTPPKARIVVARVFATWCPYCKEDLAEIGKRFKSGAWKPEEVHVLLLSYKNRREDKTTYDKFLRDVFPKLGIPLTAAQVVYVNREYDELKATKTAGGELIFPGWKGVPYALVFGKDGRLADRGHFTSSPATQAAHYRLITDISKETCHKSP